MKKADLKDVLGLVKDKLSADVQTACGLFWPDAQSSTRYSVGEEDATTDYSVGEEDVTTYYAVGEEDVQDRYGIGE